MPRSASVAVTVALVRMAPAGSVTVPRMSPDAPTPCAYTRPVAITTLVRTRLSNLNNLIVDPPVKIVKQGRLRGRLSPETLNGHSFISRYESIISSHATAARRKYPEIFSQY